jgi:gliding motility-associated-like protein
MYHIENGDTLSYMYFPNSFSPTGDGSNDLFYIVSQGISQSSFELKIYRKNGEVLFISTDIQIGWDGTSKGVKSQNGLYYYKVMAQDNTGFIYDASGSMYLYQ